MKIRRLQGLSAVLLVIGALVGTSVIAGGGIASADARTSPPTSAPGVPPPSGSGCNTYLGFATFITCVAVTGTALHVKTMTGYVHLSTTEARHTPHGHIELYGPHGLIKNGRTGNLNLTTYNHAKWSPNATETAGQYCAETWLKTGTTRWTSKGVACVGVS